MSMDFSAHIIRGWALPTEVYPDDWENDELLPMVEGHEGELYTLTCDDYQAGFGLRIESVDDELSSVLTLDLKPEVSDAEIEQRFKDVFGKWPSTPPKLIVIPQWN